MCMRRKRMHMHAYAADSAHVQNVVHVVHDAHAHVQSYTPCKRKPIMTACYPPGAFRRAAGRESNETCTLYCSPGNYATAVNAVCMPRPRQGAPGGRALAKK